MPVIARDIRYPGTPTCFEVVHDALAELWTDAEDVDPTDRMLFETALIEIVGNLVEHSRTPGGLPVDVHMQLLVHGDVGLTIGPHDDHPAPATRRRARRTASPLPSALP